MTRRCLARPARAHSPIDFRDPHNGIVGGGDLDAGDPNNARTAISSDGGRTGLLRVRLR